MSGISPFAISRTSLYLNSARRGIAAALLALCACYPLAYAQQNAAPSPSTETAEQKVQRLTAAMAQVHAQMGAYQKQLQDMQQQLADLQKQLSAKGNAGQTAHGDEAAEELAKSVDEIRERQAVVESQVATQDQAKVESASKYPVKVTGLVLFNGFVNTRQVDAPPDPTYAVPGGGSTGLSFRQTILGVDARGPHLFGASSRADVRVDFFASGSQSGYDAGGVLRLRTAHAALDWTNTEAFVELDRPLLSPNTPTSLVATAQPEFAWSGNLWTWNPQAGITHEVSMSDSRALKLQAAFIDVADPHLPNSTSNLSAVSQAERSRWPGTEARIAFEAGKSGAGLEFGAGGYFSPHETYDGSRYNAWAGTLDFRAPLSKYFEVTANAYRGQALGGLGAGGFVDYIDFYQDAAETARPLDDVGGWTQLKSRLSERIQLNGGYGIDNPFAHQIRDSMTPAGTAAYPGLARNRSAFGNVIYSPSAYLIFSLEYRRLWTNYINGPTYPSDAIGIGAGYSF